MGKEGNPNATPQSTPLDDGVTGFDPYSHWSNEQRMEEFAETGDVKYLTVELARKMGLGLDFMKEITGATRVKERNGRLFLIYYGSTTSYYS
jgi:hypothetical protein